MKNLDESGSLDDLKHTIAQLTEKYEALKREERAEKIALVRDIIKTFQITAEELGFTVAAPRPDTSGEKKPARRPAREEAAPLPAKALQQPLW